MTRNEQLAVVVHLACLTADRTDPEQRALLAVAWECDKHHNQQTSGNRARRRPDWQPQDLVTETTTTRNVDPDAGEHPIAAPKGWADTWARWTRDEPLMATPAHGGGA